MNNLFNDKKIIFFGNPQISAFTLEALVNEGYNIVLCVTNPPKPQGRHLEITKTPTQIVAEKNNIPVLNPEILDEDFTEKLKSFDADLFVVIAYGKILPEKILEIPKIFATNIHYSLLPKHRGASPIESTILNNEKVSGVSIQKMAYKMDSGDIIAMSQIEVDFDLSAVELKEKLMEEGVKLLLENLPDILEDKINLTKQDENEATYCKKIKKEDGELKTDESDLHKYRKFLAYKEWPKTFYFENDERFIVTEANFIDEKFVIKKVLNKNGKVVEM